jgi:hypothetical protein
LLCGSGGSADIGVAAWIGVPDAIGASDAIRVAADIGVSDGVGIGSGSGSAASRSAAAWLPSDDSATSGGTVGKSGHGSWGSSPVGSVWGNSEWWLRADAGGALHGREARAAGGMGRCAMGMLGRADNLDVGWPSDESPGAAISSVDSVPSGKEP